MVQKQYNSNGLKKLNQLYKLLPKWSKIIIGVASTITALVFLITFCSNIYVNTFGQKAVAYQNISKLAAEEQIGYFNSALGQPVFKNAVGTLDEFIYVNKYFFVQALCDKGGRVVLYSITTRSKDFNPVFTRASYSGSQSSSKITKVDQKIILGETSFTLAAYILGVPDGLKSFAGVRRYGYSEAYYFGNPGNYQYFIFSQNDAGVNINNTYLDRQLTIGLFDVSNMINPTKTTLTLSEKDISSYREKAIINTYTVTSPNFDIKSFNDIPIGVNGDQTRVLDTLSI